MYWRSSKWRQPTKFNTNKYFYMDGWENESDSISQHYFKPWLKLEVSKEIMSYEAMDENLCS